MSALFDSGPRLGEKWRHQASGDIYEIIAFTSDHDGKLLVTAEGPRIRPGGPRCEVIDNADGFAEWFERVGEEAA